MINILFGGIVGSSEYLQFEYVFDGQKITVTYGDETDVFDFTDLPDGGVESIDIETILPINPIISANKKDGELWVHVLNFISEDATEIEKYPEWIEVGEENGEV